MAVTAYAREELDKKGMDGSQITGTASSYARKYALNGLFLIDDTKDKCLLAYSFDDLVSVHFNVSQHRLIINNNLHDFKTNILILPVNR